jgi:uncharacterized protein YceK
MSRFLRVTIAATVIVVTAIAMGLFVLTGCGTFRNLEKEPTGLIQRPPGTPAERIYGGVRLDAEQGWGFIKNGPDAVIGGCLFIDLPISAVADTLTLPITLRNALTRDAPVPVASPASEPPPKRGPPGRGIQGGAW